jgi:hypothetical protein
MPALLPIGSANWKFRTRDIALGGRHLCSGRLAFQAGTFAFVLSTHDSTWNNGPSQIVKFFGLHLNGSTYILGASYFEMYQLVFERRMRKWHLNLRHYVATWAKVNTPSS